MPFFVRPSESLMDKVVDPAGLVARNPEVADRFDAIQELRALDDGSVHRGNDFRRVASLMGPIEDLLRTIEPEFLSDKKKFYAWLDANPENCTYDRRRVRDPNMLTNGIVVTKKLGEEA
jgi:hypothetical protein